MVALNLSSPNSGRRRYMVEVRSRLCKPHRLVEKRRPITRKFAFLLVTHSDGICFVFRLQGLMNIFAAFRARILGIGQACARPITPLLMSTRTTSQRQQSIKWKR